MAVSYDVDPLRPETHRNFPAPALDPALVEELTRMGGTRNGEPILRLVWGQERRWFFAGEQRIRYTDDRIEPVITHTPDSFAVKDRGTGEVTALASYADMLAYDEHKFERVWTRGSSTAEFIGQPLWFVEQWKPAEMIDTPGNWERNRYGEWEDPATGRFYPRFDLLGPYPSEGRYEAFFVVGEPTGDKDPWGNQVLKYRPAARDVLESVRRRLYEREHATPKSEKQHVRDRWREQEDREQKQYDALRDRIRQELRPHKHRFLEFGASAGYTAGFRNVRDFKGRIKRAAGSSSGK